MKTLAVLGGKPRFPTPLRFMDADITREDIGFVLKSLQERRVSRFTNPVVIEFEEEFARYLGAREAISVTSGTAALHTALGALGIGPGDEVLVPDFAYVATMNAVLLTGATPILVDVDPKTFNIDPEDASRKLSQKTKALIAVHVFGNPASMDRLRKVCRRSSIHLIEDCAQAIGTKYGGRMAGTLGDIACFSFFENKHITTGEGGMVVTNDSEIAYQAKLFMNQGETYANGTPTLYAVRGGEYPFKYSRWGVDYRLPALNAALGLAQLRRYGAILRRRLDNARALFEELDGVEGIRSQQKGDDHCVGSYFTFSVLANEELTGISRDALVVALEREGVPAVAYYPTPLHELSFAVRGRHDSKLQDKLSFKGSNFVSKNNIGIPCNSVWSKRTTRAVGRTLKTIITEVQRYRRLSKAF